MFDGHDHEEHAREAEERWGDTDAYRQSQQRMADLGGSLNVESAPGGGCSAVLCMPVDRLTGKD